MNRLSEGSRRDIWDLFSCGVEMPNGEVQVLHWSGKLDDADFLQRLYDLTSFPSHDYRYRNAEGDIRCHTEWGDWDLDWVFKDRRFNLLHAEDEVFLKFLCEIFHPAVLGNPVDDEESPEMYYYEEIQKIIRRDGYELYKTKQLGNMPVFAWREVGITNSIQQTSENLKKVFSSKYMSAQIDQMQKAVESNPTDAIGKAKDLVESCCKTILEENNVSVDETWEIPKLIKETTRILEFLPENLDNEGVEDALKKLVGNLSQMTYQLATIRNKMGTGHGKARSFSGLEPRHAKLAVSSASTLCWFLWETHEELRANCTKENQ